MSASKITDRVYGGCSDIDISLSKLEYMDAIAPELSPAPVFDDTSHQRYHSTVQSSSSHLVRNSCVELRIVIIDCWITFCALFTHKDYFKELDSYNRWLQPQMP